MFALAAETIKPFSELAMKNTATALEISAIGLAGIFTIFIVIWGFVVLLNKATAKKAEDNDD
ncbi:MAG: hypothetical protein ABFC62_02700 [Clostridiaceae bacterium]|nr:hypothetical protein [Eubacteriales bacterium]